MPGGRPSKPLALVKGHRTKAEKTIRQEGEESCITGVRMQESDEVKNNPVAHKQFKRMKTLYAKIGKDDALYEQSINRYCIIYSEVVGFEARMAKLDENVDTAIDCADMEPAERARLLIEYAQAVAKMEFNLMSRRKMLLDIEKESATTLASALRSIPKTPEKKEKSKMAAMLEKRQAK